MAQAPSILAIDQGTTSSRAILFGADGHIHAEAQQEFAQHFPANGWVEHDAGEIWQTVVETVNHVLASGQGTPLAVGITNQRETVLLWDTNTGEPVARAIVWQDRRTAETCEILRAQGHEDLIRDKTGLLLDPYFSASKIAWLLDNGGENGTSLRARAEAGDIKAGTIDSYLIYRLTAGKVHATDATNASRTSLFNIHTQDWDDALLALFKVPRKILPTVKDCVDEFGATDCPDIKATIPIKGVAGDQQAASIGQGCFQKGGIKSTYGTGCFVLLNTGEHVIASKNKLLGTVAYRLNGNATYALEGSIFIAGAAIQWLRDALGLIKDARETEAIAAGESDNKGVYLVPAFTGMGAPFWDADARGTLVGLTRDAGAATIIRATLESIAYQTRDLFDAMARDGVEPTALKVDGGMAANSWMVQFLADILGLKVDRPRMLETTALGAAFLAGLGAGIFSDLKDIDTLRQSDRVFEPRMTEADRAPLLTGWDMAIKRTLLRD